jgi:hypothetical protein
MPYNVLDPALAAAAPTVIFGAPESAGQHPAGKSLGGMRTTLVLELGNRTDLAAAGGLLDEKINDAYLDMYTSLDLPESVRSYSLTLVPGQALYLLPSTVDTVRAVSATDPTDGTVGGAIQKIDIFTYRKLPVRDDDPESWFREQNMLVFWPTPVAADIVSVDVRIKPAKLSSDTHYPILEDKWHEALLKGAKYRAWEALQNDTKSLTVQNEMVRLVQRRNDRTSGDQDEQYPSVRPIRSRRELMAMRSRPRKLEPGDCDDGVR